MSQSPESDLCIDLSQTLGLDVKNPEAEFKKIDYNNGGEILFDEFCYWAANHQDVGCDLRAGSDLFSAMWLS